MKHLHSLLTALLLAPPCWAGDPPAVLRFESLSRSRITTNTGKASATDDGFNGTSRQDLSRLASAPDRDWGVLVHTQP